MNERLRNFAVGMTAIAGLVGLGILLLMFGSLPTMLERGYSINVQLPSAGGLSRGNRVRFAGVDVGAVSSVDFMTTPHRGVIARAHVSREVTLHEGVIVRVQSPLIGGSPTLEIDPSGVAPDAKPLPTDGTALLRGEAPSAAGQFAHEFKNAMEETLKGPMGELEKFRGEFHSLSAQWTQVGQNMAQLTNPAVTPAQVDAGEAAANVASVLARADRRLKEMETALNNLNKWVGDEKLRADMQAAASGVRRAADKFDQSADQVKQLTSASKESLDRLSARYLAVADDLSAAITAAHKTLDQAREGEGTVGQLLNNPALYNNLNNTVQRVDKAMVELRLLIEKWKAEGLPVRF